MRSAAKTVAVHAPTGSGTPEVWPPTELTMLPRQPLRPSQRPTGHPTVPPN